MIAEMTAKMHKMPLGTKTESRLWSYMRLLLGLCPDGPEAFAEAKRAAGKEVPDMDVLKRCGEFEVWLRLEMTRKLKPVTVSKLHVDIIQDRLTTNL